MKELNREQLLEITNAPRQSDSCPVCSSLLCPGWISIPGYFDRSKLSVLGTLRQEGAAECWDEYHPDGTHLWSEDAPISVDHHPYNQSDVLECVSCKRKFLQYTEYGGYYRDERIRELNPALIV